MTTPVKWIPWFMELQSHRKVRKLAKAANIHPTYALGILAKLWMLGASEAQDGELVGFDAQEIGMALGFETDDERVKIVDALVAAEWLDEYEAMDPNDKTITYAIHDWMHHTGAFIAKVRESREYDRQRKRRPLSDNNGE